LEKKKLKHLLRGGKKESQRRSSSPRYVRRMGIFSGIRRTFLKEEGKEVGIFWGTGRQRYTESVVERSGRRRLRDFCKKENTFEVVDIGGWGGNICRRRRANWGEKRKFHISFRDGKGKFEKSN